MPAELHRGKHRVCCQTPTGSECPVYARACWDIRSLNEIDPDTTARDGYENEIRSMFIELIQNGETSSRYVLNVVMYCIVLCIYHGAYFWIV